MSVNLSEVASEEAILALIIIPVGCLGSLLTFIIFAAIIKASYQDNLETIWKSRTLFEAFSLLSSIVGFIFGVYGLVFLRNRVYLLESQDFYLNFFIFHRFLLIGSDLFPSLDRCIAVLYPLRYYTRATPKTAFGKLPHHATFIK